MTKFLSSRLSQGTTQQKISYDPVVEDGSAYHPAPMLGWHEASDIEDTHKHLPKELKNEELPWTKVLRPRRRRQRRKKLKPKKPVITIYRSGPAKWKPPLIHPDSDLLKVTGMPPEGKKPARLVAKDLEKSEREHAKSRAEKHKRGRGRKKKPPQKGKVSRKAHVDSTFDSSKGYPGEGPKGAVYKTNTSEKRTMLLPISEGEEFETTKCTHVIEPPLHPFVTPMTEIDRLAWEYANMSSFRLVRKERSAFVVSTFDSTLGYPGEGPSACKFNSSCTKSTHYHKKRSGKAASQGGERRANEAKRKKEKKEDRKTKIPDEELTICNEIECPKNWHYHPTNERKNQTEKDPAARREDNAIVNLKGSVGECLATAEAAQAVYVAPKPTERKAVKQEAKKPKSQLDSKHLPTIPEGDEVTETKQKKEKRPEPSAPVAGKIPPPPSSPAPEVRATWSPIMAWPSPPPRLGKVVNIDKVPETLQSYEEAALEKRRLAHGKALIDERVAEQDHIYYTLQLKTKMKKIYIEAEGVGVPWYDAIYGFWYKFNAELCANITHIDGNMEIEDAYECDEVKAAYKETAGWATRTTYERIGPYVKAMGYNFARMSPVCVQLIQGVMGDVDGYARYSPITMNNGVPVIKAGFVALVRANCIRMVKEEIVSLRCILRNTKLFDDTVDYLSNQILFRSIRALLAEPSKALVRPYFQRKGRVVQSQNGAPRIESPARTRPTLPLMNTIMGGPW